MDAVRSEPEVAALALQAFRDADGSELDDAGAQLLGEVFIGLRALLAAK